MKCKYRDEESGWKTLREGLVPNTGVLVLTAAGGAGVRAR